MELGSRLVGNYSSTKSGFGFVMVEGEDTDIFIKSSDKKDALNGDEVEVRIIKKAIKGKKPEGRIEKVLKRSVTEIVGIFKSSKSFGFVIPDDKKFDSDIFIPKKFFSGAKTDDKVVCEIITWPTENKKPEAKVIDIIGKSGDRYVEIDSIIRSHKLPNRFPKKLSPLIDSIPDEVSQKDIEGRLDLRDHIIFTIDGDDSKDFDDAVEVYKKGDNFILGVHIADVSHYVGENTLLDKEALNRATSVYMVDKVIPMLPEKLSNGICSLNPRVDRLALSCIMEVEPKNGKVVKYEIKKTVINSKSRFTYTEVSDILEKNDEKLMDKYKDFVQSLKIAQDLAFILNKRRKKRGAIDFDFPESKINLDKFGYPINIEPYERRTSNKMIEEFMLLANETVAEHYFWLKYPFLYRVHEMPDEEKIFKLREYVNELDYKLSISRGGIRSSDLQKLLNSIEDREIKKSIGTVMLRSLKQAKYVPECLGHFGLSAKYYCHFTSPIRRYPDLQIHRIISEDLAGKFDEKRRIHYEKILENVANQSSTQEREAELAQREVGDYYKAVYMSDFIGEQFEGHISGVTSFGIFVELENGIEGLIRLRDIPEYLEFNEKSQTLVGELTGAVYKIGMRISIEVDYVNIDTREIDFSLVDILGYSIR